MNPSLMAATNASLNNYQSTSDSADSPVTSPSATNCSSPIDHLVVNGGLASPTGVAPPPPSNTAATTTNVVVMRDMSTIDENAYMAFKQEPGLQDPNEQQQHQF